MRIFVQFLKDAVRTEHIAHHTCVIFIYNRKYMARSVWFDVQWKIYKLVFATTRNVSFFYSSIVPTFGLQSTKIENFRYFQRDEKFRPKSAFDRNCDSRFIQNRALI